MEKRKISINDLRFENFEENHVEKAYKLALCELEKQKSKTPELPDDTENKLKEMLYRVSSMKYGKVAIFNDEIVGYIAFLGPWDGFFGDVAGVFSPLGASAFSYDFENRDRLASMLFASVAEEFVKQGVFSCSLSRYADDEQIAKSFVLNGFGIRCSDAVNKISNLAVFQSFDNIHFVELPSNEFERIRSLRNGLVKHLAKAPIFYPTDIKRYDQWFLNEGIRVFVAESDGKIIGFISIDDDAENFITEHDKMKNICGAYFDENYRGCGVAENLLLFIADKLKAEGVTHLGVDYETLNPTALNFWSKYFKPYTFSFARRIDERINR